MKTIIKVIMVLGIMLASFTAQAEPDRTGRQVARQHAKWSVKGGKKTIKSFRKLTRKK